VEVRVSEALRGSIKIVPTTLGFVVVPALTTSVESAARYPNPLFRIGLFAAVEVSFRYIRVLAAVPVVLEAVTVTENVADFPIVPGLSVVLSPAFAREDTTYV